MRFQPKTGELETELTADDGSVQAYPLDPSGRFGAHKSVGKHRRREPAATLLSDAITHGPRCNLARHRGLAGAARTRKKTGTRWRYPVVGTRHPGGTRAWRF